MRKRTVLFFVFDGFADWESAYAMVGIQKSGAYQIKTIALYECQPAVNAYPVLTAAGNAPMAFASAVFEMLGIRRMDAVSGWLQYFENGESVSETNLAASAW